MPLRQKKSCLHHPLTPTPTSPLTSQTPANPPARAANPCLDDGLHQLRALRRRKDGVQRVGGGQQGCPVPLNGLPPHVRQVARLCGSERGRATC